MAVSPLAAPSPAQDARPVVIIDQERLFRQSAYGQRVLSEIDRESAALAAENRRIEAELVEAERELTALRSSLPQDEFRARARAFDARVKRHRSEQDAKTRALSRVQDTAQQDFFREAGPVLSALLDDLGASVLLDSRAVLAASGSADITAAAIERLDATLGAGEPDLEVPDAPSVGEPDRDAPETANGGGADEPAARADPPAE